MIFEGEVFQPIKKSVAKKPQYFCNKLIAHARPFRKLDSFEIEKFSQDFVIR